MIKAHPIRQTIGRAAEWNDGGNDPARPDVVTESPPACAEA
jgi:hypothetical protein